jgi:hypothetical protein
MPMLQVADFPVDIYDRISAQAFRENISFEQQVITLLGSCLPQQENENQLRRRKILARIKARNVNLTPEARNFDVVEALREMREERMNRILC